MCDKAGNVATCSGKYRDEYNFDDFSPRKKYKDSSLILLD